MIVVHEIFFYVCFALLVKERFQEKKERQLSKYMLNFTGRKWKLLCQFVEEINCFYLSYLIRFEAIPHEERESHECQVHRGFACHVNFEG